VAAPVKDVLYSTIEKIGREKIRMEIAADIKTSEKYCMVIITQCSDKLDKDEETTATLSEALLHFMLTASLLPSERKISFRGAELDVVIPSVRVLDKSPDQSLVIQVVKGDIQIKIKHAGMVQPNHENTWLISAAPLQTNYKNYHMGAKGLHYSNIISDISKFLSEKGDRGLKLLPGQ
jgi:hypothetical protein